MDLTTVARVRQLAGVASSGTEADALLQAIVTQVSSSAFSIIARHGPKAERTETYVLRPRRSLVLLDGCPVDVTEDVEVFIDDVTPPDAGTEALLPAEYILNGEAGWLQILDPPLPTVARRSRAPLYVQIRYTAGLADDVDALLEDARWADLVGAVTMQARHLYERRDKLGGDLRISMGGGAFSSEKRAEYGLLPEVERTLQGLRRGSL